METQWKWSRRVPHLLGHRKRWHRGLAHPFSEDWHWGLKAELSAEDLEAEPQTGTNSVIDTVWAREMADQRVEEAIPQLGEKKERLKSQSLALASMATQMRNQQPLSASLATETSREEYPIHYSMNVLDRVPPPGFPPPLPIHILQPQAQSFTPQASPFAHQLEGFAPQTQVFVPQTPATQQPQSQAFAQPQLGGQQTHHNAKPFAYERKVPSRSRKPRVNLRDRSERGRGMAAAITQNPQGRQRTLSPADIGLLTERAGRRNASRELNAAQRSSSGIPESHLPQNASDLKNASSPLALTQYPQQASHSQADVAFAPSPTPPHSLRISRTKLVDRGLGYELGLNSNMPSQLPRNPQEAAYAARHHAQRVRNMQLNLAADPNIMVPQASSPTQLTAAGPPLTGHDTTSTATLPSVLTPYSRTPLMTYAQALQAIITETGSLQMLLRLELLEPALVTVLVYDDIGRSLGVSEDLVLDKKTDLKTLINSTQELLNDMKASHPALKDGDRFIITHIEVRNGSEEMKAGHPALKGEPRGGEKGKSASFVRWICNGDMEMYWKVYRIVLQTQAPQPGDKKAVVKPIFRVKTIRQASDSKGVYHKGHKFVDVLTLVSSSGAGILRDFVREKDDGGDNAGGPDTGRKGDRSAALAQGVKQLGLGESTTSTSGSAQGASSSQSGQAPKSSRGVNQINFGGDAAASTPGSINDGFSNDKKNDGSGSNAPESSQAKDKTEAVEPTRNWGYYQRMGGDPRMHKLFPLDHVPFDVKDFPAPKIVFDSAVEQNIIARIQAQGWNFEEPRDLATPKASSGPTQPVYSATEKAWRDKAADEFERAISFEDDDSFFPNYDTQITDARKIVASRLIGGHQQSAKGKSKESTANNDMSALGGVGLGLASHVGKGKTKQTGNTSLHGGLDPSQARIDRIVSRYASTFNNPNMQSPMASATSTPNTKSPLVKMNVHAPDFNYQQLIDRSSNNSLSPYLQSLVGPQPSYTQPNPIGHIQTTFSANPDHYDCFTTFSQPNLPPQQSNSSIRNSPEKEYAVNTSITPVPQFNFAQNPMFNNSMYSNSSGASSPEKAMFAGSGGGSRLQSPDRQYAQEGRYHGQRRRSPDKFNPAGHGGVPILRYPSPDKRNTQQGQTWGFQYSQDTSAGQMPCYHPFNESATQQGSEPGFQYGQNAQFNFDFDSQPHGQGSGHDGGQGPM